MNALQMIETGLEAASIAAKVNECKKSVNEIGEVYQNSNLSEEEKTVSIVANGVFVVTQTTELVMKNNVKALPIVNTINGVADIVRTGVNGHIHQDSVNETALKITQKTLSHSAEAVNNLALQTNMDQVPILKAVCISLNAISWVANYGPTVVHFISKKFG